MRKPIPKEKRAEILEKATTSEKLALARRTDDAVLTGELNPAAAMSWLDAKDSGLIAEADRVARVASRAIWACAGAAVGMAGAQLVLGAASPILAAACAACLLVAVLEFARQWRAGRAAQAWSEEFVDPVRTAWLEHLVVELRPVADDAAASVAPSPAKAGQAS